MTAFLLSLLFAVDIDRLGHPDWPVRESAELRLADYGSAAWPALLAAGVTSECAEVRARVDRLLAPYRAAVLDGRAYDVLTGPWPPGRWAFWYDERLRLRTYHVARLAGCPHHEAEAILPGWHDHRWWWWYTPERCQLALEACRARLGCETVWWSK